MSRIKVTWVIRTIDGQLKGPYSTEAILRMIAEGVFSGQEMISKQPGGEWQKISREPEFYDKLLEALEGVVPVNPSKAGKMEAETVIAVTPKNPVGAGAGKSSIEKISPDAFGAGLKPATSSATNSGTQTETEKSIFENARDGLPSAGDPRSRNSATGGNSSQGTGKYKVDIHQDPIGHVPPAYTIKNVPNPAKSSVIDLANLKNLESKVVRKKILGPLIGLIVAVIIFAFVLLDSGPKHMAKIHLLAPGPSKASLSETEVRKRLIESIKLMEEDTFESYLSAQNRLISIIEGAPTNIEVRAMLCVVYNELWPYATQDAQDIRTVTVQTQQTRSLNVISPFGQVCEVVKLMTAGRLREARGQVEATLEEADMFSLMPVLYSYKAELLLSDSDYINAIPYYEKAIQMWETWLQPHVSLAKVYMDSRSYAEALEILKKIIQANPKHKEAQVMMGISEYRGARNNEAAFTLLSTALAKDSPIPTKTEVEGLSLLSELYLARGEKSKALQAAEKAYELSPNNSELKQLVLRLGGSDKLKDVTKGNAELLILGDQYHRQGDYLAAQAEYKAAFEADPKNGTAAMKAAKSLWELNQGSDAIAWLDKAIRAEPKLIPAYVTQADFLSQRYDFVGAQRSLATAMKLSPNNHEVLRGFSQLEFRKNNMQSAITYGLRATKIYEGDVETFILLSQANASLAQSIVALNKQEIERKENSAKDAVRYATKAVEIDSTNPKAQINYAKILALTNGVDAGITYMSELVKRFSYTMDYRLALAEIYAMEERYNQAAEIYSKIIEHEPRNRKAFLGLADSQKALGLTARALKSYFSAAVIDPSDGEALFRAGQLYLELGKNEEAIQQFQRVQRINVNYPRTSYLIGRAAYASGDFDLAMNSAKEEKRKNPNLADSYILMAEVMYAKKQYSECASEYATAMKLRPQGADIYVKSAQCYRQAGSLDVAEAMLSLASARESGYAEIYREQGAIYEVKGDGISARQAYEKYLGLSPNAPDRSVIEQKLNSL